MADQITDNRTNVTTAESLTGWTDLAASAAGTVDDEIFIEGLNSIGLFSTNSLTGLIFDFGATDVSNNTFYIWINCGIVGLLELKANGGFRIRFTGSTITDFFEVYVGGNDDWPTAIAGGWVQFVVDIEEAHANSDNTGGTKPATSSVEQVGFASLTTVMPRMADNTWIDHVTRLPDATPGIIVEGKSGGVTDWNSADIAAQLGVAVGTFVDGPGGSYVLRTPIQFGIDDVTDHGFDDSNVLWLWDNQEFVPDGFYGLSAVGNASTGTNDIDFGIKTGTGDDATGAQGVIIQSAATGPRWFMDFDDPNLDSVNFYGCNFIHGGIFQLDDPAVSCISTLYLDCSSAFISNSEQLRCNIIAAATADGVAFMTTDDLTDVVFCEFQFSDGHGVELTTTLVTPQTSKGNKFTGYGANDTNDAALYNNAGGAVTINVTDEGDTPTRRNGTSATTTINNTVTLTVNVQDTAGAAIDVARVRIQDIAGAELAQGSTNGSGVFSDSTFNYVSDTAVQVRVRKSSSADNPRYSPNVGLGTIQSSGFNTTITMIEDNTAS